MGRPSGRRRHAGEALRRVTEVIRFRTGEDPSNERRTPGVTAYEPITLERGVTHDVAFEAWANKLWALGRTPGAEVSLRDFRKNVRIELRNEAGQVVIAYLLYRCWPAVYIPLAGLDSLNGAVAIESLTLEHEGWERDQSVQEPEEPAFDG